MGNINQTILPLPPSSLSVYYYRRQLAGHAARALSEVSISKDGDIDTQLGVFGVSISQLDDGGIDHIAFATDIAVYLIEVGGNARGDGALDCVFQKFLGSTTTVLAGFGMPRISLRLRHNLGYHVRGVDLSTLFSSSTSAWRPSKVVQKLCAIDNTFRVDSLWHENDQEGSVEKLCLRAWISAKVGRSEVARVPIENVRKVDTRHVRKDILSCLGTLLQQTDVLARAAPRVTHSEHESYDFNKDGKMKLQNSRYKTRVRVSKQSYVEVVSRTGKVYQGEAVRAKGKTTEIAFRQGISEASNISSVRIVGLEEPTPAEKARDTLLLRVLKDEDKLLDADFVRYLWFRTREDEQILRYPSPDFASSTHSNALKPYVRHLNDSQARVVTAMTSNDPIVIVHGPPGTGKTTTISSAAEVWSKMYSLPVWIIGHSNVSVKNIAEKLLKRDVDFKLIVSKEFYVEWHEHIYEKITARLIRTDELPDNVLGMSRSIGSSTVILSTLGLLSNAALEINGLFRVVSVERLVIDEASQINVFEYMHIFHKFRRSLVKVCFFGDSKQLPPFGQERVKTLQSIFDIEYLKPTSYFLDVQYRLPVPLGEFISMKVYENQLKSFHSITQYSCVRFVDTPRGVEERSGVSWINLGEISVIVNLIKNYYRKKNFCVITPYDAQRAAIEKQLKQENIPWEKVFNVDSFQGNEADYVLLSVVRSAHVGFLHSPQRMNVMLTRCRRGMVIVSSQSFLEGVARDTLVGKISAYWTVQGGKNVWVDAMDITNSRVDLPGAPGSKVDPAIATARDAFNSGSSRLVGSGGSGPTIPRTFDVSALFRKRIIYPNPGTPAPVTRLPLPIAPKFATINTVIEALPSRKDDRHFPTISSTGLIHNRYSLLSSGKKQAPKRNVWADAVYKSSSVVSPLQRTCQPPRLAAKNSVVPQSFMKDYSSPDQHFVHQSNPLYIEWAPWHSNDYGVSLQPSPEDGGDRWTIAKRRKNRILS